MNKVDAIYARQSVDKADSISIESQIEFCRYETKGAPCEVYFDKGYSGKNTQRPQFLRMLCDVRAGRIKRVICYKLDRCSRSILDFTRLMEELQQHHVEFVSCTEKFDTSTPMGRAMLSICIVFAQLERETIQQRISDAYHSRSRHGFFMGGRLPFGFGLAPCELEGKKTSKYIPLEEEIRILKFMYSVYEKPQTSLADVVLALNEQGVPNPRRDDGLWFRSHIGRILRNPIYVRADPAIYQYYTDRGVTIENNQGDFIGVNGCYRYSNHGTPQLVLAPHEGIVSGDTWLKCALKRTERKARKATNTWLGGTIKCGKCGYALVVRQRHSDTEKLYRYMVCSRSSGVEKQCDGVRGIRAEHLEGIIADQINRLMDAMQLWDTGTKISAYTPEGRNMIVRALIRQIAVDEDRIVIHWKL